MFRTNNFVAPESPFPLTTVFIEPGWTSLTALISFIIMTLTSIILYIVPQGRPARRTRPVIQTAPSALVHGIPCGMALLSAPVA